MKPRSIYRFSMKTAVICGLAAAMSIAAVRAQADQWDKTTVLTINQPIQITDTYLDPGTYVLRLVNSNSNRHIVQIFDSSQTHVINTILAIPNYRLEPTGDSRFKFWETPPGTTPALRAWFYPGDNYGQEFSFPKHLKGLASLTTASAPEPAFAPEPPAAVAPEPAPASAPPVPQSLNQESQPEESSSEIAQETPAPAPQAAPPAPEQTTQPEELPQTSTPYPLIGLGGLLSLGLYGLVRLTRPA